MRCDAIPLREKFETGCGRANPLREMPETRRCRANRSKEEFETDCDEAKGWTEMCWDVTFLRNCSVRWFDSEFIALKLSL